MDPNPSIGELSARVYVLGRKSAIQFAHELNALAFQTG